MRRHGIVLALILLPSLLAPLSCFDGARIFGPDDWEVLARFSLEGVSTATASPDGALFVATTAGIYRSIPSESDEWVRVVDHEGFLPQLWAPSREAVFARSAADQVHRWRTQDGWQVLERPSFDTLAARFGLARHFIFGLWGTSEDDVYVVGDFGVILHFDGQEWAVQPNPFSAAVDSPGIDVLRLRLRAVGGDEVGVYTAGFRVLHDQGDGWVEPPLPSSEDGQGLLTAIAAQPSGVLFAGTSFIREIGRDVPVLLRLDDGRSEVLTGQVRALRDGFHGGGRQPDGSAVFWTFRPGEVVRVFRNRIQLYRFSGFSEFRAAAWLDGDLFVAGAIGDTGVVARLRAIVN